MARYPDYSGMPRPSGHPDYPGTNPDYPRSRPDYPDYPSSHPDYPSSNPDYPSSRPDYPSSHGLQALAHTRQVDNLTIVPLSFSVLTAHSHLIPFLLKTSLKEEGGGHTSPGHHPTSPASLHPGDQEPRTMGRPRPGVAQGQGGPSPQPLTSYNLDGRGASYPTSWMDNEVRQVGQTTGLLFHLFSKEFLFLAPPSVLPPLVSPWSCPCMSL